MLKRSYKLIICVVLVTTLLCGITVFASAEPAWLIRAKAAIAAAALAGNLVLEPVNVVLNDPLAEAIDPLGRIEYVETLPEYLDRSVIYVRPDVRTIDGVAYSELWLGPDAADSLRTGFLDFATAYNIANNQDEAITYASGVGKWDGLDIYNIDGVARSQTFYLPFGVGSVPLSDNTRFDIFERASTPISYGYRYYVVNGTNHNLVTDATALNYLDSCYYLVEGNTVRLYYHRTNGTSSRSPYTAGGNYVSSPFRFDYTSGVIDAPLDPGDGLLITFPSSYTDPDPQVTTNNYDIHDLINIYPTISQPQGHEINIDPELNPDFQTDIDLGDGVGDLIQTILRLIDVLDLLDFEFAPKPDSPEPAPVDPDPAIPDTPVGEQDGTWLDELLRWIKNAIDVISQSVIDAKDSIINEIQDLAQQLSELPQQILEDIETGPSKVFRKALDVLKSIFLPLLLPIKAMMNLWHYVVEWLSSIASPFLWIFGVMSGTSYNMVLPIYAGLAGAICIAIYKALGR